jgi:elongation factor P
MSTFIEYLTHRLYNFNAFAHFPAIPNLTFGPVCAILPAETDFVIAVGAVPTKVNRINHKKPYNKAGYRMKASEMKKGQTIKVDNILYAIVDYQHVKLGKGGAVYQTKLKSLVDGLIRDIRVRAEEVLEDAFLDKRNFEFLYSAGTEHVLMDLETYDQISLDDEVFGEGQKYLKPNTQLQVSMYQDKPVQIMLPTTVDLKITDTTPEIKGATATNQYKPATLETGLIVQVPPFVKVGEMIRVDTRNGEYVTRVKD